MKIPFLEVPRKVRRGCIRCRKSISEQNKSGYCNACWRTLYNREKRKKWSKEGKCLTCGGEVEPIITYPNGLDGVKLEKKPIRCYACRIKQQESFKRWRKKKNE